MSSRETQAFNARRMATVRGPEDTSRGICEGELININEGSGFDKKDEDVP